MAVTARAEAGNAGTGVGRLGVYGHAVPNVDVRRSLEEGHRRGPVVGRGAPVAFLGGAPANR